MVIANRILAHEGVVDGFGHVRLRHPDNPERYLLSQSRSPELVTLSDIMEFTLEGEPIDQVDGLESPADGKNIVRGLISRGYSDQDVRKLAGGNALAFFRRVMS